MSIDPMTKEKAELESKGKENKKPASHDVSRVDSSATSVRSVPSGSKKTELDPNGKENKKPTTSEVSRLDNSATSVRSNADEDRPVRNHPALTLPTLPSTPDANSRMEMRRHSPVRFPTLLVPSPDRVTHQRPAVAGILFLPSIL